MGEAKVSTFTNILWVMFFVVLFGVTVVGLVLFIDAVVDRASKKHVRKVTTHTMRTDENPLEVAQKQAYKLEYGEWGMALIDRENAKCLSLERLVPKATLDLSLDNQRIEFEEIVVPCAQFGYGMIDIEIYYVSHMYCHHAGRVGINGGDLTIRDASLDANADGLGGINLRPTYEFYMQKNGFIAEKLANEMQDVSKLIAEMEEI